MVLMSSVKYSLIKAVSSASTEMTIFVFCLSLLDAHVNEMHQPSLAILRDALICMVNIQTPVHVHFSGKNSYYFLKNIFLQSVCFNKHVNIFISTGHFLWFSSSDEDISQFYWLFSTVPALIVAKLTHKHSCENSLHNFCDDYPISHGIPWIVCVHRGCGQDTSHLYHI